METPADELLAGVIEENALGSSFEDGSYVLDVQFPVLVDICSIYGSVKKKAALLTEALAGLRVRYGGRVLAPRRLI